MSGRTGDMRWRREEYPESVAGRQDSGFGPGWTPDYNVTFGLYRPFLVRDPLL